MFIASENWIANTVEICPKGKGVIVFADEDEFILYLQSASEEETDSFCEAT